jgi:hypothetical protein
MRQCKCGSFAIKIDPKEKVCDVCFWKNKYNKQKNIVNKLIKIFVEYHIPCEVYNQLLKNKQIKNGKK